MNKESSDQISNKNLFMSADLAAELIRTLSLSFQQLQMTNLSVFVFILA